MERPERGRRGLVAGFAVAAFAVLFTVPAVAGRLYKWVDENGKVHYGDHVPAKYASKERRVLNDRAIEVQRIEAAKTPEQIEAERRLEARRREEARRRAEQLAHDRMLLSTFASVDDMEMAREGKIQAIDSLIRVTKARIAKLEEKLTQYTRRAAMLERAGRPVPKPLRSNIEQAREQIRRYQEFIESKRVEQERIRATFEKDIARFRELKALAAQAETR